ncbi:MAG: flagellar basal body rod protein FlgB [Burkholderiales bacterium]|nr:flagellar basal body rod protein FlgB [Burkholderiales bacterium]
MIRSVDDALRFNEQALKLRAQRQAVLASNIAHADTPNFKAVDVDFAQALKRAVAQQASPGAPARTDPAHLGGAQPAGAAAAVRLVERETPMRSADGNTVNMDRERAEFAANTLRYEAALRFLHGQIKSLLAALQG